MDFLWTPWRFRYVATAREKPGCVFCDLLSQGDDRASLILLRKAHTFLLLNRFPYTAGHLMVVTRRHLANLQQASSDELTEMILLARECEKALQEIYQPDGWNIGFNVGNSAGAGVAGHLHLHVVPRWTGDANFVSVLGETRVIPEDLETTYAKLHPCFHPKDER